MTGHLLTVRDEISRLWHEKTLANGSSHLSLFSSEDDYLGFCAAKDWLQDTGEALLVHRRTDFSSNPHKAYLEFWGILQATVVQQDAIMEMRRVFSLPKPEIVSRSAWQELRDLRHLAVGHPTRRERGGPLRRSVTGRDQKTYRRISLMVYGSGKRVESRELRLGDLLDRYDAEAAEILRPVLDALR